MGMKANNGRWLTIRTGSATMIAVQRASNLDQCSLHGATLWGSVPGTGAPKTPVPIRNTYRGISPRSSSTCVNTSPPSCLSTGGFIAFLSLRCLLNPVYPHATTAPDQKLVASRCACCQPAHQDGNLRRLSALNGPCKSYMDPICPSGPR